MKNPLNANRLILVILGLVVIALAYYSCSTKSPAGAVLGGDEASEVYVGPGEYDDFYAFLSGGFSGQVSVYGLPSVSRLYAFLDRARDVLGQQRGRTIVLADLATSRGSW